MASAGLWMLLTVGVLIVVTGLPAWLLLILVSTVFGAAGVAAGLIPLELAGSLPARLLGLLEADLLQALVLFALMGALLNRMPLAQATARVGERMFDRSPAAPALGGLLLGTLFAPMNGSAGATVAMLAGSVGPRLQERGIDPARRSALLAAAGTLGVVVPPSLVLILLSDAMLRAHTEAVNITQQSARIINLQDIFRGALVPAGLLLLGVGVAAWWSNRHAGGSAAARPAVAASDWIEAAITALTVGGLLAAVVAGRMYAVEAAATGACALFVYGVISRALSLPALRRVLEDAMSITGALLALLIGATVFTLTVRAFGTDRALALWIMGLQLPDFAVLLLGLGLIALCAFVLDAFEMIFVVVPLVAPALLVRMPDATWVAVLILLVLQTSFVLPPVGYAVLMVRSMTGVRVPSVAMGRALAPYLLVQILVLAAVLGMPQLVWRGPTPAASQSAPLDDESARRLLEQQTAPEPGEPPVK